MVLNLAAVQSAHGLQPALLVRFSPELPTSSLFGCLDRWTPPTMLTFVAFHTYI